MTTEITTVDIIDIENRVKAANRGEDIIYSWRKDGFIWAQGQSPLPEQLAEDLYEASHIMAVVAEKLPRVARGCLYWDPEHEHLGLYIDKYDGMRLAYGQLYMDFYFLLDRSHEASPFRHALVMLRDNCNALLEKQIAWECGRMSEALGELDLCLTPSHRTDTYWLSPKPIAPPPIPKKEETLGQIAHRLYTEAGALHSDEPPYEWSELHIFRQKRFEEMAAKLKDLFQNEKSG